MRHAIREDAWKKRADVALMEDFNWRHIQREFQEIFPKPKWECPAIVKRLQVDPQINMPVQHLIEQEREHREHWEYFERRFATELENEFRMMFARAGTQPELVPVEHLHPSVDSSPNWEGFKHMEKNLLATRSGI